MSPLLRVCFLLAAFALGSLPFAYWLGLLKGVDIRQHGSGNPGATNAFRVLGKGWGILCLVLDALKGAAPVLVFGKLLAPAPPSEPWLWALAWAAILGHMFSPFLHFKGGKGVATSLGVLLAIEPSAMLIALVVGIVIIGTTGYVSLASMVGAVLVPLILIIYHPTGAHWVSIVITILLAVMIIWRHRANIGRLRAGNEKRIFHRKKD
jgi:glycerol-3-phosphate acyltransferase PlsY